MFAELTEILYIFQNRIGKCIEKIEVQNRRLKYNIIKHYVIIK